MIEGEELKQKIIELSYRILNQMDNLRPERAPYNHGDWNWASELPHPCRRFLVYCRLDWKERRPMDINGRYRVEVGSQYEEDLTHEIKKLGFDLRLQQQSYRWKEYLISGRIDGGLTLQTDTAGSQIVPVEVTTVNPVFWASITSAEAMKRHEKFWIRKKPGQLNVYLFQMGLPGGALIVGTFGKRPKIFPMLIDYELGEEHLKKAEAVNAHVKAGTYPDRIQHDSSVCGLCDFQHLCQPVRTTTLTSLEGINMGDLGRFCDLKPAVKEFERLRRGLIGSSSRPGPLHGVDAMAEDFIVSTTRSTQRRTIVPEERKEEFIREIEVVKTTIERMGGD